jgi:PKD repeat protein
MVGLVERMRNPGSRSPFTMFMRLARTCVLALVGSLLLLVAFTVHQVSQGEVSAALACGLGNPQTMLANKIPALLYPITPDMPQNAPQGVFPLNYLAGSPVAFTEDLSRVPGAPKLSSFRWKWNFGDKTSDVLTESPTHTFTQSGTYYVGSWIWDTTVNQWVSFDSAQIHVVANIPSSPPVAKASSNLAVTVIGQSVTFDANGSHAADGSQLKYLWNFNDGATATTAKVEHQFPINGSTFAALVVTDARGAQSLATVNITIQSQAPTASFTTSDPEVDVGTSVSFDASQSVPPQGVSGDAIASYVWDFGDGTPQRTTKTPTTSHTYQKAGNFTVTLTVFDTAKTQATTTLHVKVLGAAGGLNPLVLLGILVLLVGVGIAIYAFWQQRQRAERVRQYQQARALARTRQSKGNPRGPNSGNGSGSYRGAGQRRPPASNGSPRRSGASARRDW